MPEGPPIDPSEIGQSSSDDKHNSPKRKSALRRGVERGIASAALVGTVAGAVPAMEQEALAHPGCTERDPRRDRRAPLQEYRATINERERDLQSSEPVFDPVYATKRNFTKKPVPGYESREVWLHPEVDEKLPEAISAARDLLQRYGVPKKIANRIHFIVKDGYRPHESTHAMADWAKENGVSRSYVAANISGHNKGGVVDLTLGYRSGKSEKVKEIWMGSLFDEFNTNARHSRGGRRQRHGDKEHSYKGRGFVEMKKLSTLQLRNVLKEAMADVGGRAYKNEWWHYTVKRGGKCYDYPIE